MNDTLFLAATILLAPHLTPQEAGRTAKILMALMVLAFVIDLLVGALK